MDDSGENAGAVEEAEAAECTHVRPSWTAVAMREPAGDAAGRLGSRYRIDAKLGRGGMAVVYRVTDRTAGCSRALKQLRLADADTAGGRALASFELEYQTLAELAHPRMIQAFDYGLAPDGPFYTMELLDGGDLRELAPLPWRRACQLVYDVASSLALLHARGLLHRDVSPRNVRCTSGGEARLIDFGALTPMGTREDVVGTPAFIAPESAHRAPLDGRTDLFSLGATLYYALTGRAPYPARDLRQLTWAWSRKPLPPSRYTPAVPAALDRLVMSLLALEPAMRMHSAFEVMQRLMSVAALQDAEPLDVISAYLASPMLMGRDAARSHLRQQLDAARDQRGRAVRIAAPAGAGRSRMLDTCILDARTRGLTVLAATARHAGRRRFAVAQQLARQLVQSCPDEALAAAVATPGARHVLFEPDTAAHAAPRLRSFASAPTEHAVLQAKLSEWMLRACGRRAMLIAVDDVHRIDDASVALLAQLAHRAPGRRLLVAATIERSAAPEEGTALQVFIERSEELTLDVLARRQTEALLASIFGDVPNLALLCERVYDLTGGNPRECTDVARYLIDREVIRYEQGAWTLPASLPADKLPASAKEAFLQRVAALRSHARKLLEIMALATYEGLAREECVALLDGASEADVDESLCELVAERMVEENEVYTMAHGPWADALTAGLDEARRTAHHRALATLYERTHKPILAVVRHQLSGGMESRAIGNVVGFLEGIQYRNELQAKAQVDTLTAGQVLRRGLASAERLRRPAREIATLRRGLAMMSAITDDRFYWEAAPDWLAQLEHDSGLRHWRELDGVDEPMERLTLALQRASQQYESTPEAQRVYTPDEAIRMMAHYVATSIAVGARTQDPALLGSLPGLLEPFTPLSPLLEAVWHNALATYDGVAACRYEQARSRWLHVLGLLDEVAKQDPQIADAVRHGIRYAIGAVEGRMGLGSVTRWAETLDDVPSQRVNGMYLRRIACLQQGDWEGAERFRKRAEVAALQADARQLFNTTVVVELGVQVLADDLAGVKQSADRIEPLAERYPGWAPYRHLAYAHFERMRGNPHAALHAAEACVALCDPETKSPEMSMIAWPWGTAAHMLALVDLGKHGEATRIGERALEICKRREIGMASHEIARALALAEGKLGAHAAAARRLERLIEEQTELGVTGLNLGASYEARARVAIWAGEPRAVETYTQLTAREYRHGRGSALGARYERLMEEARTVGARHLPELRQLASNAAARAESTIAETLRALPDASTRARRGLGLICDAYGARAGHLYIRGRQGLMPAASHPAGRDPSPELSRFAADYFHGQLQDDLDATVFLDGEHDSASEATEHEPYRDADGRPHRPLLLVCETKGIPVQVGVAVVEGETTAPRRAEAWRVAAAVAAELTRIEGVGVA